jgi:hypothetical protein
VKKPKKRQPRAAHEAPARVDAGEVALVTGLAVPPMSPAHQQPASETGAGTRAAPPPEDEALLPKDLSGKIVHVIEECAEVQQAATKALRFGLNNWHPSDPLKRTNASALRCEIVDLYGAMGRLLEALDE